MRLGLSKAELVVTDSQFMAVRWRDGYDFPKMACLVPKLRTSRCIMMLNANDKSLAHHVNSMLHNVPFHLYPKSCVSLWKGLFDVLDINCLYTRSIDVIDLL